MALPGELVVVDDVADAFAHEVIDAFRTRSTDTFSLALTGGRTARRCYERLAEVSGSQIDWWKVDVYWADERCIPHDHEDSHYRLVREALLDRVGAANATHLMRCAEGADAYQLRLGDLGRIDLVHLSLAADGTVASLFPGSAALDADPGRLVAENDDPLGRHSHRRMTLTAAGIGRAHRVLVTASGAEKAAALAAAGRPDAPARALAGAPVRWLVDLAASGGSPALS